jgi:hypothetical protein
MKGFLHDLAMLLTIVTFGGVAYAWIAGHFAPMFIIQVAQ